MCVEWIACFHCFYITARKTYAVYKQHSKIAESWVWFHNLPTPVHVCSMYLKVQLFLYLAGFCGYEYTTLGNWYGCKDMCLISLIRALWAEYMWVSYDCWWMNGLSLYPWQECVHDKHTFDSNVSMFGVRWNLSVVAIHGTTETRIAPLYSSGSYTPKYRHRQKNEQ